MPSISGGVEFGIIGNGSRYTKAEYCNSDDGNERVIGFHIDSGSINRPGMAILDQSGAG